MERRIALIFPAMAQPGTHSRGPRRPRLCRNGFWSEPQARGISTGNSLVPVPHDDSGCWQRLLAVAPYFRPHLATRGAAISEANPHEGATYPYPLLMTLAERDEDLVANSPKQCTWVMKTMPRQIPIDWLAYRSSRFQLGRTFYKGAIRYFHEIERWTSENEAHNQQ